MSSLNSFEELGNMVSEIIRSHFPDLTKKELEVCRTTALTMWGCDWDVADYPEVVARLLDSPAFDNQASVEEVIASLVKKGVLEDKEIEFLYGPPKDQVIKNDRVLAFARKKMYERLVSARRKLV